jgi:hypothetical protein
MWAGTFQMPSDYRHAGDAPVPVRSKTAPERRVSRAVSSDDWSGRASGGCNIKGNRNRKVQWIQGVPGVPRYDGTRADGVFCTGAEARAAGYRRAIVR